MSEMVTGARVEIRFKGCDDDEWLPGTVADRPRKMWVLLDEGGIADENSIEEWRLIPNTEVQP